jgi:hypothetical protein
LQFNGSLEKAIRKEASKNEVASSHDGGFGAAYVVGCGWKQGEGGEKAATFSPKPLCPSDSRVFHR